jgi:hypothetical protein
MDFYLGFDDATGRVVITAEGEILAEDGDAFLSVADQAIALSRPDSPFKPLVSFDSPGGDVGAGVMIGEVIRHYQFDTHVPADGLGCHSSCTIAFIGGIKRRVEGVFGIHAMNMTDVSGLTDEQIRGKLYGVQGAASILIDYGRDMLGNSTMMETAMTIGSPMTTPVTDAELAAWGIITSASRPSQFYPAADGLLANCTSIPESESNPIALGWLCGEVPLATTYRDIETLTADLSADTRAGWLITQVPRFEESWRGCAGISFSDVLPENILLAQSIAIDRRIPDCIAERLKARHTQLSSFRDYLGVVDSDAAAGWAHER